jgi:hypothetical protein
MNKVWGVVCCLAAALFGSLGFLTLLFWLFSPDHAGELTYLLFGLFLVCGSIVCMWGAWRILLGEEK